MGIGFAGVNRRRLLGALCLGAAVLMLVLGETVLNHRLSELVFLLYWIICFVLTCMAIGCAFLDVRAMQQTVRKEQRSLLDETMREIEGDARAKKQRTRRNGR